MGYLLAVSCIWAFSFGTIKVFLVGVDPFLVAWVRVTLALLVFLPFLWAGKLTVRQRLELMALGAVQYGVMYMAYLTCFSVLQAYQAALFTIFTPLYVVFFNDLFERRFNPLFFGCALVSVVGAGLVKFEGIPASDLLSGFFLMQVANASFAWGQVYYKRWRRQNPGHRDREIFALLYAGASLLALAGCILMTDWGSPSRLTPTHAAALLYLGIVASGLGFFLWNVGATKTNAGTLAVFNNVLVPLAVVTSLVVFQESRGMDAPELLRLMAGGGLILAACYVAERTGAPRPDAQPANTTW